MRRSLDRRRAPSKAYEKLRGDLLRDITGDGDVTQLRTADIALAESAALLILRLDVLRDEALSGGGVCDDDKIVKIANAASRLLAALRGKRRGSKRTTTLDEYLNADQKEGS